MRPTLVVHVVEGLGLGGLERVVLTLAKSASPGYRVEVLALARGGGVAEELKAAGIRVSCLRLPNYYPGSVLRAARALVGIQPDIVHTHGHFAGVAGRLAARLVGLRGLVHHLHTADPTLEKRHLRLERLLARVTRRVLCCSLAVAEHARRDLGLPDGIVEVVPNGIETAPQVSREEARRRLGDPREPVVGCVGSLAPHKGQAVLLRAFAALDARDRAGTLVLVGDGAERAALEGLADLLGVRGQVLFLGQRPDVRSFLAGFDLLVAPSIGREGLGVAVLEGMDAGLPVVASRVGGLPEALEDGRTGILVPEGDPAALSAAMTAVLSRPDRGAALGAEGKRAVEERFRAAAMVRRIETIYEVALDPSRRAA